MNLSRSAPALCLAIPAVALIGVDLTHGGFIASMGGAVLDLIASEPVQTLRILGTVLGMGCASLSLLALAPGKLSERLTCLGLGALGVGLVACVQCLGA